MMIYSSLHLSIASDSVTIPYKIPINFYPQYSNQWHAVENYLTHTNFKTYTLDIKGTGGDLDMMYVFADVIQSAQKQGKVIIFNLVGDVWSAHADIICYADSVNMNGYKMHYHSGFSTDEYGDVIDDNGKAAFNYQLDAFNVCKEKRILDQKQIDYMSEHDAAYHVVIK